MFACGLGVVGCWKGCPARPRPTVGTGSGSGKSVVVAVGVPIGPRVVGGRGLPARPRPTVGTGSGSGKSVVVAVGVPIGPAWLVVGGSLLVRAPPWVPGVPGTTKANVGHMPVGRGCLALTQPSPTRRGSLAVVIVKGEGVL